MQDTNKTRHHSLVEGDGTQNKTTTTGDANWFGRSKEPQEEFVKGDGGDSGRLDQEESQRYALSGPTSEGKPSL